MGKFVCAMIGLCRCVTYIRKRNGKEEEAV